MVTSRDVARLAGVSQATVSRAMSPSATVSEQTRARIQEAMDTLGYVRHAAATAMKTNRTNTIGVVVADLVNPFYQEVLDELTREIARAGYRIVVWNTGGGSHGDAITAISERAVDGVAFTTAMQDSEELRAAVERGSPVVLINRSVDGIACDQVISANREGGAQVADYLIDNARTDVAFINGVAGASTSRERQQGFLERMRAAGHPVPEARQFEADFSHEQSYQVTRQLLRSTPVPEAIFCANDFMAFGALDAVKAAAIPAEQVPWIIGFDDVDMASWKSLDLTTVRQPSREMARAGAHLLLARINDPAAEVTRTEFACQLVVRGSTSGRPVKPGEARSGG